MDSALTKKKDFLKLYYRARKDTINTKIMHKCFKVTSLILFNP